MRLFFDESGFTGEDLANREQPVFVVASMQADELFCDAIYRRIFAGVQSRELKHSSLVKTAAGRRRVHEFLTEIRASGKFASFIVHKEFCLLTKLVDLWLEPALWADGIDFYKDKANLGFCNMAWQCLRTFESTRFVSRHLFAFQEMMRTRTQASYDAFWRHLRLDSANCGVRTKEILDFFLYSELRLGARNLGTLPEKPLDVCLTCALQILGSWRGKSAEDFEIVHDNSSNMSREKWIWDAITSPEMPKFIVGTESPIEYPLRVIRTTFADSAQHLQLQFVDIVAGATAAWARSLMYKAEKTEYAEGLEKSGVAAHLVGGIWPTDNVEPIPDSPGAISANEYIDLAARVIRKARR